MTLAEGHVALLLRLMEARELFYTHASLVDYHGATGQELIDAGLMIPAGFDDFTTAHEVEGGEPVQVEVDPLGGGLGYHSRHRGWVPVEKKQLLRYRLDLAAVLKMLLGDDLIVAPRGPLELEPLLAWEVGRMRLLRTGLVEILFARRLGDREALEKVRSALDRRPSEQLRLLLTTTRQIPIGGLPSTKLVPIVEVLSSFAPFRIDTVILKARFAGRTAAIANGPLHLSEDGRTLTILDNLITFGGINQQKALRLLVDAYHAGKGVNAADTLEAAGFGPSIRTFAQAFRKQWPQLKAYLRAHDRMWRFEL